MLSTTVHFSGTRPDGVFSTNALRSATAARGHTSPGAYWCSALTISVAPAWRTWSSVTGSSGPYQRHACRIEHLLKCLEIFLQVGGVLSLADGSRLVRPPYSL